MTKEVLSQSSHENKYLHRDFHGALNHGLQYLGDHYGREAVVTYLRDFAREWYAPLMTAIADQGLEALAEHFTSLYAKEEAEVDVTLRDDTLEVKVPTCPAMTHIRNRGFTVSEYFGLTTSVINQTLCEGTAYHTEVVSYDESTGASHFRFWRAQP
ncbi:MAG: hypothetical protein ACYTGH_00295 [Planctomycetota bacterium]|jgi:hypothetical protein